MYVFQIKNQDEISRLNMHPLEGLLSVILSINEQFARRPTTVVHDEYERHIY